MNEKSAVQETKEFILKQNRSPAIVFYKIFENLIVALF